MSFVSLYFSFFIFLCLFVFLCFLACLHLLVYLSKFVCPSIYMCIFSPNSLFLFLYIPCLSVCLAPGSSIPSFLLYCPCLSVYYFIHTIPSTPCLPFLPYLPYLSSPPFRPLFPSLHCSSTFLTPKRTKRTP